MRLTHWRRIWIWAAAAVAAALPLSAQQSASTAQDRAFARMYAAPQNPAAILAYADASISARDFEAAAAALERLIALEPANLPARMQLALAYFALGANANAQAQIEQVLAAPNASADLRAQALAYQTAAATRQAPAKLTGVLRLGSAQNTTAGQASALADVTLTFRQDFGTARGTHWDSTLTLAQSWTQAAGQANAYSGTLRTGPSLALGTARESARLAPFVMAQTRGNRDNESQRRAGAGITLTLPLGDRTLLVAEGSIGSLNASTSTSMAQFSAQSLSAQHRLTDRSALRLRFDRDARTGLSTGSETEDIWTLDLWQEFRPAFAKSDRNWRLTASLRQGRIDTASADPDLTSVNLSLRGWISNRSFAEFGLGEARESDGQSTATSARSLSLRIGLEF